MPTPRNLCGRAFRPGTGAHAIGVVTIIDEEDMVARTDHVEIEIERDLVFLFLQHSAALVEDLALRPVIGRLARLILDEVDRDTLPRPSWYTQNELAARLGTVAVVIQPSLSKLEADNLIEVERRQILIINQDELEKLAA